MKTTFHTHILQMGNNTGLEVPPENIAELGSSKKPAVKVTVNRYSYSSTVAMMGGKHLVAFSSAHRAASGLKSGDAVEVTLELETAPRTVEVPADLQKALTAAGLEAVFAKQAPSKRKEFVRQVEETKSEETRARRVEKILAQLGALEERGIVRGPASSFPKIGAPALRALTGAGYTRLEQLTHATEAKIAKLHGMGPKALRVLREALEEKGLKFESES